MPKFTTIPEFIETPKSPQSPNSLKPPDLQNSRYQTLINNESTPMEEGMEDHTYRSASFEAPERGRQRLQMTQEWSKGGGAPGREGSEGAERRNSWDAGELADRGGGLGLNKTLGRFGGDGEPGREWSEGGGALDA